MSNSVQPHRQQPTRLPHPWDSQGKNTGVGCHFLLQCMKMKSESEVAQSCPTLSDPMDCSPLDSSIHGIFQARVLEWGAIAFSKPIYHEISASSWVHITAENRSAIDPGYSANSPAARAPCPSRYDGYRWSVGKSIMCNYLESFCEWLPVKTQHTGQRPCHLQWKILHL